MNKYKSDKYGEVQAPESLFELFEILNNTASNGNIPVYYWRGQSNIDWHLHSSAARRIINSKGEIFNELNEKTVRDYEQGLLANATHQGYRFSKNRQLNDLELMAKLQHYGAATRLVDFTKNMLIGLWFASAERNFKKNFGLLIGVHTDFLASLNYTCEEEPTFLNKSIGEMLDDVKKNTLEGYNDKFTLSWEPPPISQRILVQHSTLLFSEITNDKYGSLHLDSRPKSPLLIAPDGLQVIMNQLERFTRYLHQPDHKRNINMNLLFYGAPGTGKSELARYIGHVLDREILCKRASDILNPYVGGTEVNIKNAFQEAEVEDAVLVIDEVDSLLFNRGKAVRSWEISLVNEFLSQMENFRGILICTTNRLCELDEATMRRFNFKIEFRYLTGEGNIIFYRKLLGKVANTPIDTATISALKRIPNLAPGDFKIVRARFLYYRSEQINHRLLLQALQDEVSMKQVHNGSKAVGF